MSLPAAVTQDTRPMKPTQEFKGHSRLVYAVTQLRSGQRIMTCSYDGSLRIWNMQTGKQIARWEDREFGQIWIWAISLSPDEKKVVSGSNDGAVRLWNIDTGKVIAKWTGHTRRVTSLCWNQGAERVVSGSWDGTARVWDVESGRTVLQIYAGLSDVRAAIYSPDTTKIATGGGRSHITIWDANTGELVANLTGHTEDVSCLAWTADGRTLVSGSWDYSIRTWNTTTWQQIAVLTGHTSVVYGIAISPNDQILASASWNHTVRLWNLENSQPIGSPLQHPNSVYCVSFSIDGHLLATGCADHNAYTWDISGITHANATNPFAQSAVDDNTEEARDNPYGNFFASSQSSLPTPSSDPSSTNRLLRIFLHLLRTPANESMHLNERHHLFDHRALSVSPSQKAMLCEQTKPTPEANVAAGVEEHVDLPDCSTNLTPCTAEPISDTGKQQETTHMEIPSSVRSIFSPRTGPQRVTVYAARPKKLYWRAPRPVNKSAQQGNGSGSGSGNSSQPSQGNVVQHTVDVDPLELHVTTPLTTPPDVIIRLPESWWTRFRIFICCMSVQHPDSHH